MPKPNSSVGRMKHLLDTGNGADVHFLLLAAHKLILSAASDVFEAMFPFDARNADPSEGTKPVEVPDVEVGAFKAMLSFIYVDDVSGLNGDNAIAVLYAAKKYDLPELIKASPKKTYKESRTLYTVDPIKKSGIYYYEVKVKERKVKEVNEAKEELKKGSVSIGLGPKERVVGDYEGFAYDSCGIFAGYKAPGCPQSRDRRFYDAPKFGARDVVGCGVDFATGQIFYTKNGQRFDPVGEFVDSAAELFPRVSLTHPDVDIEENFGPVFAYKF
uniref:B30.2/SPRY domain-containing protein n=1 Tax=Globodera pallida TaxID=36090 RepID=A0A183C077_GLOPA